MPQRGEVTAEALLGVPPAPSQQQLPGRRRQVWFVPASKICAATSSVTHPTTGTQQAPSCCQLVGRGDGQSLRPQSPPEHAVSASGSEASFGGANMPPGLSVLPVGSMGPKEIMDLAYACCHLSEWHWWGSACSWLPAAWEEVNGIAYRYPNDNLLATAGPWNLPIQSSRTQAFLQ